MSLLRCGECTTEYAAGLTSCPHCASGRAEPIGGPSYLNPAPVPVPEPTAGRQAATKPAAGSAKPAAD